MNPKPIEEAISSAATRNSQAWASARRSPETTEGTTAGSWIVRKSDQPRRPKQRPASTRWGSMWRSAAATVVNTGKKAPIAISVIFDSSPICSHRISSGTQASEGTARRAASVGFSSAPPARDRPTTAATARPTTEPAAKPISTRCTEIAMCSPSSPRSRSSAPACTTAHGPGRR